MMNSLKKVLLSLICLLVSVPAANSQLKPVAVYLGAGLTKPTSDKLDEGWKMGPHGELGIGIRIGARSELNLKASIHTLDSDESFLGIQSGARFTAILYGGDLKYSFGLPVLPLNLFLFGGAGLATLDVNETVPPLPLIPLQARRTRLFLNIGVGLDIAQYFGQIRVVHTKADDITYAFLPITLGLKF